MGLPNSVASEGKFITMFLEGQSNFTFPWRHVSTKPPFYQFIIEKKQPEINTQSTTKSKS